ncbi:MAG TPA: diguanylate cyclase, partial [Moraxellaceae bacterium]
VGMVALQEPVNARIAMAILVVCFTIVFCTGMQPLRTCVRIATTSFFLTALLCWAWGHMPAFWSFAFQFAVIFAGMALICHFMMRSHRQTFLHEQLLHHDRERLTALTDQLADLSLKDALTGVANRRRFDEVLEREWERGQRQQSPLALLFVDVDHFKAYNDHYGHQAGDDCLMAVAFVLQDAGRRPGDLVARYGGEEFVLLLPDTNGEGAKDTARRIQAFLQQAALPHAASAQGMVTASIGVAVMVPDACSRAAELVAVADRAVYAAKAAGRNGVMVAEAQGFVPV